MHVFYLVLTKINDLKNVKNINNESILFSPLNWGWGHVSRAIPLLLQLQGQANEITIACDAEQQKVFEEYLVDVTYLPWPGYPFRFRGKGNFALDLILTSWKLRAFAKQELAFVEAILKEKKYTLILSDQRYFFRSKDTKSIFITHQLNLPTPYFSALIQKMNSKKINRFDEVWVMDDSENSFAGKLSISNKKVNIPIVYIGTFSRFSEMEQRVNKTWTTVLVSGPEPYANQFYEEQKKRFGLQDENFCMLYKGNCESKSGVAKMTWKQLDERLLQTKKVIARSGYSSLMDVRFLGCDVEWHPTPGQWEQQYLAEKG